MGIPQLMAAKTKVTPNGAKMETASETQSFNETVDDSIETVLAESSEMPCWSYICLLLFPLLLIAVIACKSLKVLKDSDSTCYSDLTWFRLLLRLFARMIKYPRQGRLHIEPGLTYVAGGQDMKPDCRLQMTVKNHKLTVHEMRIDREHLDEYKKLCGYGHEVGNDKVPVCYPETLFLKPLINVITSSKFCLSPLGLIHLRQTIKQHVQWDDFVDKKLKGEIIVKKYCDYDRGVEVDIVLRLLGSRNLCIWEGTITLLSRKSSSNKRDRQRQNQYVTDNCGVTDEIDVPADCGLKYARLTGDWNPHHLYRLTALLLGYSRPIAHGMWTLSRTLAQVERRHDFSEGGVAIFCAFKRPLFLPGKVAMKFDFPNSLYASDCKVTVVDKVTGDPHANITVRLK